LAASESVWLFFADVNHARVADLMGRRFGVHYVQFRPGIEFPGKSG